MKKIFSVIMTVVALLIPIATFADSYDLENIYVKEKGESGYNIKIRFSERDGSPMLYDEKEREISWHLNRFNL